MIAVVTGTLVIDPSAAVACSCVSMTQAQMVDNANVIFAGTVTDTAGGASFGLGPGGCYQRTGTGDPVKVTFAVETVYKGDIARTVTVSTAFGSASCGYVFVAGKKYTVFATTAPNGGLATNLCSGNLEGTIDLSGYALPGHPPR